MELKQVKGLLHQTKCGEMFMDGMGCSEPILTQENTGLIDNFFVYLIDKRAGTASGPLARIGLHAESGSLTYLTSANERPFSVLPSNTIPVNSSAISNEDYEDYSALYAEVRKFAFKRNCTTAEKTLLSNYLTALRNVVSDSLYPFYGELAPTFFEWSEHELAKQQEDCKME